MSPSMKKEIAPGSVVDTMLPSAIVGDMIQLSFHRVHGSILPALFTAVKPLGQMKIRHVVIKKGRSAFSSNWPRLLLLLLAFFQPPKPLRFKPVIEHLCYFSPLAFY